MLNTHLFDRYLIKYLGGQQKRHILDVYRSLCSQTRMDMRGV